MRVGASALESRVVSVVNRDSRIGGRLPWGIVGDGFGDASAYERRPGRFDGRPAGVPFPTTQHAALVFHRASLARQNAPVVSECHHHRDDDDSKGHSDGHENPGSEVEGHLGCFHGPIFVPGTCSNMADTVFLSLFFLTNKRNCASRVKQIR